MTPSEAVLTAAAAPTITDATGRRIALRRLTALDKLRLFKAAGSELSQNQPWLGMAVLACSVTSIDDVPVPPPMTEQQIESMISRLGDAGVAAVAAALSPAPPSTAKQVATVGN